jgi:hypothetical protein
MGKADALHVAFLVDAVYVMLLVGIWYCGGWPALLMGVGVRMTGSFMADTRAQTLPGEGR